MSRRRKFKSETSGAGVWVPGTAVIAGQVHDGGDCLSRGTPARALQVRSNLNSLPNIANSSLHPT